MVAMISGPRLLYVGGGAVTRAAEALERLEVRRPLIVTDPFLADSPLLRSLTGPLAEAGLEVALFADTVPDPTTEVVDAGLQAFRDGGYDGLIGFGGGSPMDTAKAIALLDAFGGRCRDWKVPNTPAGKTKPVLCIPTTAGTGSEVTKATVVTDTETDEKMLIMGLSCQPEAAVVDFELTLGKPFRLTADTGIDSLTHAIEAYVSRKASPHTDALARSAMGLIAANLRTACFEPGNRAAREAMMLGATQAGMAFSNSSVALVHGMSRPIGAHFHVPHGLSNAMLLPSVTSFSIEATPDRYADCARAMGVATAAQDDGAACDALLEALRALNADLQVPTPKDYGIEEAKYFAVAETMAQQAVASGSPNNNPRVPTVEEIVALYHQVWAPNR